MSDLFISYARGDRPIAERLSRAFKKLHYSVWWDRELIVGDLFDKQIKEQLAKARCVIVLWSRRSVTSRWVQKEALFGAKRGKLIPVLLENATIPKRLRRIHAANLIGWKGSINTNNFKGLVEILESRFGKPGWVYYVPLESVPKFRNQSGGVFTGAHLKNCLNKAPSDRRKWFLNRHYIIESGDGKYLIGVREFSDGSIEYGIDPHESTAVKL